MIVGEAIFFLPFVILRVFRPTFLTVFEIDNLQLGTAFSVYGLVAMASYFLGGPLADRFSPKRLVIFSLLATALAGLILASIPSLTTLTILYGFWGLSTVLFFWAAFIKGIRKFGGEKSQGQSQGLVDGGRGFVSALVASSTVILLDSFLPVSADQASQNELTLALSGVILVFTVLVVLAAGLAWIVLPNDSHQKTTSSEPLSLRGVKKAIKHRSVWLQALIVLCAYVGFKCTDDFGLYAKDAFGYNDVQSAHIATISFWMRPIGAALAGYLGDKFIHSRVTSICFLILILGALVISTGMLSGGVFMFIAITLASMSLGIYGLRGLYYALFQESKIPLSYAGAAIGFISVTGYTPDVFMGPLMGMLLDNNPGYLGHRYLFGVLVGFGIIGLVASILFNRESSSPNKIVK
ncbi:MAG: MFS transporter [Cytophagia bacterium]|nr:MFS transporter [Cytophagia bacterium]